MSSIPATDKSSSSPIDALVNGLQEVFGKNMVVSGNKITITYPTDNPSLNSAGYALQSACAGKQIGKKTHVGGLMTLNLTTEELGAADANSRSLDEISVVERIAAAQERVQRTASADKGRSR